MITKAKSDSLQPRLLLKATLFPKQSAAAVNFLFPLFRTVGRAEQENDVRLRSQAGTQRVLCATWSTGTLSQNKV